MKAYLCNPVNISYKYQHFEFRAPIMEGDKVAGYQKIKDSVFREAADPSLILFKERYYLFPSMSKGFWFSDDLVSWEYVPLHGTPSYDYAPDVCAMGDYLYFSASKKGKACKFYRTRDPMSGVFEEFAPGFEFWDPAMFRDDDGRVYFYWGCTNTDPIYGVELDPVHMTKLGEPTGLIAGNDVGHGFERIGDDHCSDLPPDASEYDKFMRAYIGTAPFIEGAWMTKRDGRYYLQYAAPGTEYNIYGDGVYVSEKPLEGFRYAENNPYSYKPGGFITAAGHGSTMEDRYGNLWHASSMRISRSHEFERRVGLFPAGFDADGELFCNQRYGDWVYAVEDRKMDPWAEPEMFLLSYGKQATASSGQEQAGSATDEDIRTWWRAEDRDTAPWLQVDLGEVMRVQAVQINFADDGLAGIEIPPDSDADVQEYQTRYIEDKPLRTRWVLEGSMDGKTYLALCDKRQAESDLPHDLVVTDQRLRYIRLTVTELPYGQTAAVSGLRAFGVGNGDSPSPVRNVTAKRLGNLDADIAWEGEATGFNVLWGYTPEKLYHSYMVYGKRTLRLGALNKGQRTWVRVDSFNENGITHGEVLEIQ